MSGKSRFKPKKKRKHGHGIPMVAAYGSMASILEPVEDNPYDPFGLGRHDIDPEDMHELYYNPFCSCPNCVGEAAERAELGDSGRE